MGSRLYNSSIIGIGEKEVCARTWIILGSLPGRSEGGPHHSLSGGQDQSHRGCTKSEGPTWGLILFVWSLAACWRRIFVKLNVLKTGKVRWEIYSGPTCPFTHTTSICQKGDLLHSLISNARHYSVSLEYKQKRSTKRGCSSSFARIYLPVVIL